MRFGTQEEKLVTKVFFDVFGCIEVYLFAPLNFSWPPSTSLWKGVPSDQRICRLIPLRRCRYDLGCDTLNVILMNDHKGSHTMVRQHHHRMGHNLHYPLGNTRHFDRNERHFHLRSHHNQKFFLVKIAGECCEESLTYQMICQYQWPIYHLFARDKVEDTHPPNLLGCPLRWFFSSSSSTDVISSLWKIMSHPNSTCQTLHPAERDVRRSQDESVAPRKSENFTIQYTKSHNFGCLPR